LVCNRSLLNFDQIMILKVTLFLNGYKRDFYNYFDRSLLDYNQMIILNNEKLLLYSFWNVDFWKVFLKSILCLELFVNNFIFTFKFYFIFFLKKGKRRRRRRKIKPINNEVICLIRKTLWNLLEMFIPSWEMLRVPNLLPRDV
jgi:hypothetical protein